MTKTFMRKRSILCLRREGPEHTGRVTRADSFLLPAYLASDKGERPPKKAKPGFAARLKTWTLGTN